jgi:hypothetical protein
MPPANHASGLDDLYAHEGFVANLCLHHVAGVTVSLMKLQAQLHRAKAELERLPAGDPFVRSALERVAAVAGHIRNTPTVGPRLSRTPAPGGDTHRGSER